ncbi:MAG: MFS transporter [Fuerstiella sp.]
MHWNWLIDTSFFIGVVSDTSCQSVLEMDFPMGQESRFSNLIGPYWALPGTVKLLCVGSFINRAGSFVVLFLTIYVSQDLGYDKTFAANCFGVFGVGSFLASLVGGYLADRIGRKPIMLLGLFGGSAALVSLSFVQDRYGFMLNIFAFALLLDMYRPAASAMMSDVISDEQRPLAFGLLYIAFNLGFGVAAPIGGWLAEYSMQYLFWGDAITTSLFGLMIFVFLPETISLTRESEAAAEPAFETTDKQAAVRDTPAVHDPVGWKMTWKQISGDTDFLMLVTATLLTSLIFFQGFSTLPLTLKDIGFSESEIGLLLSINGFLIVALQLPITAYLSRFERLAVILAGEVLIGIGFGATALGNSAVWIGLTIGVWTIGEVLQAAFKQTLVVGFAPKAFRARYLGVFAMTHALGLMIGAPVGGQILERYGSTVLWTSCFATAMVSSGIYLLIYLRRRSTVKLSSQPL